jgi:hypothetical protein
MEVSVERHRHRAILPAPVENAGVIGGRHPEVSDVQGIDACIPQQRCRPSWHALIQQDPHEAVFISTISSPIIAAA